MKLKRFDTDPHSSKKNKAQHIRVTAVGVVSLNIKLSETLGLVPGAGISFHQDVEEKKDWYICVDDKSANKVRMKPGASSYLFNNVRLAEEIFSSVYPSDSPVSVCFPVSAIPNKVDGIKGNVYAIITGVKLDIDEKE